MSIQYCPVVDKIPTTLWWCLFAFWFVFAVGWWIYTHFLLAQAMSWTSILTFVGRVMKWFLDARKSWHEGSVFKRQSDKLKAEKEEGEIIKQYIEFFEQRWKEECAKTASAGGIVSSATWFRNPPTAAPGENPELVRKAWEIFCARHGKKY